jgi:hypothetical protein
LCRQCCYQHRELASLPCCDKHWFSPFLPLDQFLETQIQILEIQRQITWLHVHHLAAGGGVPGFGLSGPLKKVDTVWRLPHPGQTVEVVFHMVYGFMWKLREPPNSGYNFTALSNRFSQLSTWYSTIYSLSWGLNIDNQNLHQLAFQYEPIFLLNLLVFGSIGRTGTHSWSTELNRVVLVQNISFSLVHH